MKTKKEKGTQILNYEGVRKLRKINLDIALQPMMTNATIEYIASILEPSDIVFEYGSGGSTTVFSQLVKKYISVEHEPEWFNKIKNRCSNIKSVESYHVEPNCRKIEPDMGVPPAHYETLFCADTHGRGIMTKESYENLQRDFPYALEGPHYSSILRYYQFQDYVNKIYDVGVDKFDKILIDGRSRTFCAYIARHFMHKDSILLIDDILSDHPRYRADDPDGTSRPASRLEIEFGNTLGAFYEEVMAIDGLLAVRLK